MGRYNDYANTLLGIETGFASSREILLDSPTKAIAMRFETAALTPANLTLPFTQVVGNPGLALEIVSDLDPVTTSTIYVPTSDEETTGWVDQGGGAFTFADIDDRYNSAEYARNSAALAATSSLRMLQRGSVAYSALSATRILGVRIGAIVQLGANTGNGAQVSLEGTLQLGTTAVYYPGRRVTVPRATRGQTTVPLTASLAQPIAFTDLATFIFDPSTGVPWTMATINNLIAATADYGWGVTVRGTVAAGGFAVSGTWIEVFTCTENRLGYYHSITPPRAGWTRYALSGAAALSADTWYWVIASCPLATQAAFAKLPIMSAQRVNAPALASGTGEHRLLAEVALGVAGGVPYTISTTPTNADGDTPSVNRIPNEMFPVLLESAGPTVEPPSQAYANVILLPIDTSTSSINYGQQLTAGANQAYGGVQVPVLFANPTVVPDRPLVVEVRSGAGAISGAGTLHATATIDPYSLARIRRASDLSAVPLKAIHGVTILAPFDGGPFNALSGVQYHVIVKSAASQAKGWRFPRLDTRSDLIGSGPSVADIEGASHGGQTDSYFASGAAADRYDLPIALVAPSTATVLTATPRPALTGEVEVEEAGTVVTIPTDVLPPRVLVSWPATSLTTSFAGYRIYRRRRGVPVGPWVLVMDDPVGTGETAATVEAQRIRWVDYEAPWSAGEALGSEGWDYAVTVRHINGTESFIDASVALDIDVTASRTPWLTCNAAPWLNTPLRVLSQRSLTAQDNQVRYEVAGRDHAVVRVIERIPASEVSLAWGRAAYLSDEFLRIHRAASLSGRQVCVLDCQGLAWWGVLQPPGYSARDAGGEATGTARLTVTGTAPRPSGYNLPAEIAFDGTNDYAVTSPEQNAHDPGTQPFTFWVVSRFSDAANDVYLSKGNMVGSGDGYGFLRSAAGTMRARVDGASAAITASHASSTWFDGDLHAAVATYTPGGTLALYLDGEGPVATGSGTAGSIANAVALTAGADNGGASDWAAAPTRAWGVHVGSAYSADQVRSLSRYLLGHVGYRMPAGATVAYDVADDRCWDGLGTTLVDLAGSQFSAALTGSPAVRGRPWPLRDLSRW